MFLNSCMNNFSNQEDYGKGIPIIEKPYPLQIQMFSYPNVDYNLNQNIYNQLKIFEQTLQVNHTTTLELIQKIDGVSNHLNDINLLISKQPKQEKQSSNVEAVSQKFGKQDPFLETKLRCDDGIINKVFGNHNYKYQLTLSESFNKTLYKERNFKLSIKLIDSKGDTIVNSNRIPISFNAYHDEENPQLIESTRLKVPIFKGNNQSEIFQGEGSLSKLQFKQVSSYYSTKGIFFVMYAKPQSFKYNNTCNFNERTIDYSQIRPLVLKDIIVKAKKK